MNLIVYARTNLCKWKQHTHIYYIFLCLVTYLMESTMFATGKWSVSFIHALNESVTFEYISPHHSLLE